MYCKNCGAQIDTQDSFCGKCGTKIEERQISGWIKLLLSIVMCIAVVFAIVLMINGTSPVGVKFTSEEEMILATEGDYYRIEGDNLVIMELYPDYILTYVYDKNGDEVESNYCDIKYWLPKRGAIRIEHLNSEQGWICVTDFEHISIDEKEYKKHDRDFMD